MGWDLCRWSGLLRMLRRTGASCLAVRRRNSEAGGGGGRWNASRRETPVGVVTAGIPIGFEPIRGEVPRVRHVGYGPPFSLLLGSYRCYMSVLHVRR